MARFRSTVGTVLLVVMMIFPSIGNLHARSAGLGTGHRSFADVTTVTAQSKLPQLETETLIVTADPLAEPVLTTEPVVAPINSEIITEPTDVTIEPVTDDPVATESTEEPTIAATDTPIQPTVTLPVEVTVEATEELTPAPTKPGEPGVESTATPDSPTTSPQQESTPTPGSTSVTLQSLEPSVSLSHSSGPVGAKITMTGEDFGPAEEVPLWWEATNSESGVWLGSAGTLGDGTFRIDIVIPATALPGPYTIYAVGTTEKMAEIKFQVTAHSVVIDVDEGEPGDNVVVSGTGMLPGDEVTIKWGSLFAWPLKTTYVSGNGTFSEIIQVPSDASIGPTTIFVQSNLLQTDIAFEVTANQPAATIAISPISGQQGDRVVVTGFDFTPGERVNIRWGSANGAILGYKNASATGAVSGVILVPANASVGTTSIWLQSDSVTTSAPFEVVGSPEPRVTLTPTSGKHGDRVSVNGTNFIPGERVNIRWGSANGTILGYKNANSDGIFSGVILVPTNATAGTSSIYLQSDSAVASTYFSVTTALIPTASVSPTTAMPGAKIAVTGANFKSGERVNIRWGSTSGPIIGYKNATSTGAFSGAVLVPANASAGTTSIFLQSASGTSSAQFTVKALPQPTAMVSPTTAIPGAKITVSGTNFKPGERVNVRWGSAIGPIIGYKNATSTGALSGAVLVPANASSGTTSIYLQSASGMSSAPFTVKARPRANVSISNTYGTYGDAIGIAGWNFQPGEQVTITFPGNKVVGRVTVRSDGTFSGRISVPASATIGYNTITSRGGSSGFSAGIRYEVFDYLITTVAVTNRALPGAVIKFTGMYFRPGETITIYWSNLAVMGTVKVAADGTISGLIQVPANAPVGTHVVGFSNPQGTYIGTTTMSVVPIVAPTISIPATLSPRQMMPFSGSGFGPNERVIFSSVQTGEYLGSATTDPAGHFLGFGWAPALYNGYTTILAEGQNTGRWVEVWVYMRYSFAPATTREEYASDFPGDYRAAAM